MGFARQVPLTCYESLRPSYPNNQYCSNLLRSHGGLLKNRREKGIVRGRSKAKCDGQVTGQIVSRLGQPSILSATPPMSKQEESSDPHKHVQWVMGLTQHIRKRSISVSLEIQTLCIHVYVPLKEGTWAAGSEMERPSLAFLARKIKAKPSEMTKVTCL